MILLGTDYAGPARYLIELSGHLNFQIECIGGKLTNQMFVENGMQLNHNWKTSKPLAVITGTSLGNSLDKKIIQWANALSLPSISIIDHWSWYRKRFELDSELVLPNFIFVNDDIAFEDAVNEGLPSERIISVGNPVLESLYLNTNQQQITKEKLLFQYNLPKKKIIFFVSEELASDFNETDGALGYDEFSSLDQVISLLKPSDHLVIKLHPEETDDKYLYLESNNVSVLRTIDVHAINVLADVVIGMASMLLLELAILRNDVISFRPNSTKTFIGKRLSATVDVTSKEVLETVLNNPIYVEGKFCERFSGSSIRISSLIKEIIG